MNQHKLSWGLVIATYQRPEILFRCLHLAVQQTLLPKEVIVVDASDNWEETKEKVLRELAPLNSGITWQYVKADMARQTAQRNQGINLATADILFMIDDDSLMAPACAERVMTIYEEDKELVIAGVIPQLLDYAPDIESPKPVADKKSGILQKGAQQLGLGNFLWELNIFLKGPFFPPFARLPDFKIPVLSIPVRRVDRMQGCLISIRRSVASKLGFDGNIVTSEHEDSEASWRFAQEGLLLEIQEPLIHHATAPRPAQLLRNGIRWRAFWLLNHAYLNKKLFSTDNRTGKYIQSYARRTALLDFIAGVPKGRTERWKGCMLAMDGVTAIINSTPEELLPTYTIEAASLRAKLAEVHKKSQKK